MLDLVERIARAGIDATARASCAGMPRIAPPLIALLLTTCQGSTSPRDEPDRPTAPPLEPSAPPPVAFASTEADLRVGDAAPLPLATVASMRSRSAWQSQFDLDGDGAADRIEVEFSGGAHCCYSLMLALASGSRLVVPYELEGGYVGGIDLSLPEQFTIGDHDGDGRPELRIAPVTGEPRRPGDRVRRVLVDVQGSRLRIRAEPR